MNEKDHKAQRSANTALYQVVVHSIGSANPDIHRPIAQGMGLSPEFVLEALYKAPSILLADLPHDLALSLSTLLTDLGLEVTAEKSATYVLPECVEYDVALFIEDATQTDAIAHVLAEFLACSTAEALHLLYQPPSLVLGNISSATIKALRERLAPYALELRIARKQESHYDLLLTPSLEQAQAQQQPSLLQDRIYRELKAMGLHVDRHKVALVRDLTYQQSQILWRRFGTSGEIKLIDQAFERFDVVLTGWQGDKTIAQQVLHRVADIPKETVPLILANLPLIIDSNLSNKQLETHLQQYFAAGLTCYAQLSNFKRYHLTLYRFGDRFSEDADNSIAIIQALSELGLLAEIQDISQQQPTFDLPYTLPTALTDLQARHAQAVLEALHCECDIEELDDE